MDRMVDRVGAAPGTELPRRFGDYTILGHLATGGMAEVYLARKGGLSGFEKIVVIKRVKPELLGDKTATSQFLDEAKLVATLEHPNIAQVYEIGQVAGSYFFVMEYVHGADLRQLMGAAHKAGKHLELGDALYIATHVCAALHYAHEMVDRDGSPLNLIHRDVTPSNVLLSHNGAVKVCDFGIAKAHGRTSETDRGTLKGKFAYMSPEQCKCEALDRRSDIFAIGILLWEMTTLQRLFKQENDFETLRAIVELPIPPPSWKVQGYPPDLERIVLRALERDPAKRYATAQEVQLDLESFAREQKLALSSISMETLMGELFTKRVEAWSRAKRKRMTLEDHLLDSAVKLESGAMPVFLPVGASELDVDIDIEKSVRKKARKPLPNALLLVGAAAAVFVAAGVTALDSMQPSSNDQDARRALDNAAEKVASALDLASRSAHTHAESIATSPMLRAAIDTDAATMKDLVDHEGFITVGKHESLEIFQGTTTLLKIPADAAALPHVAPGDTRLIGAEHELLLVASAPVRGTKATNGALAYQVPVDLTLVKHAIAKHVQSATLAGEGIRVRLIDDNSVGDSFETPVPTIENAPTLKIVAVPIITRRTHARWVSPVRGMSIAVASALALVYLGLFVRSRR